MSMKFEFTIIIPSYNEKVNLVNVLEKISKVFKPYKYELLLFDDNSNDGTELLFGKKIKNFKEIKFNNEENQLIFSKGSNCLKYIRNQSNKGKGYAIKESQKLVNSNYTIIHDADLEYETEDLIHFFRYKDNYPDIGFLIGKRFSGSSSQSFQYTHFLANKFLSHFFSFLFNQYISDIESCFKMFKSEIFKNFRLSRNDFVIEIELISEYLKKNKKLKILEIPIQYFPRTYNEGKKIKVKDGILATYFIIIFRLKHLLKI